MDWNAIRGAALTALASVEDPDSVVMYLDRRLREAGETVEIDRMPAAMPFDGAVVFMDLEPAANWGHRCRYLLVPAKGGSLISIEARMPPFLARIPPTLEVIHQGARVPEWTVRHPPSR